MKIDLTKVTIGSDPEYGVVDQNNRPRSVVGNLPGTKKEPFSLNDYVSCQEDNVGAEICIPPCTTAEQFLKYITMGKLLTQRKLREKKPNYSLISASSLRYDNNELMSDQAMMFGCEPSYCVYTGGQSPRPTPEQIGNLRSFGFHVHVGFPIAEGERQTDYVARLIRAMDITLGLPSIIIDGDTERRQIYGNAGDLRYRMIKDVLVAEYRTLGGFMHSSHVLIKYVFHQTVKAIQLFNEWTNDHEQFGEVVKTAIDTGNVELCLKLCNQFNIEIPQTYIKKLETQLV